VIFNPNGVQHFSMKVMHTIPKVLHNLLVITATECQGWESHKKKLRCWIHIDEGEILFEHSDDMLFCVYPVHNEKLVEICT
jgi:hypothetical protein